MDPVARLTAIEEIRRLKAAYFRLLDTKQYDAWAGLFTEFAVFDVRDDAEEAGVHTGRASWVAFVRAGTERARTVHHGHTPEIDLISEDEATGIWALDDVLEMPDGKGGRHVMQGSGHYHERYRREDGRWRISSLRLERLRVTFTHEPAKR